MSFSRTDSSPEVQRSGAAGILLGYESSWFNHARYDVLNRLTSAAGGYGNLGYTYDANGNRLTENSPASTTLDGLGTVTNLTYNQANRLASVSSGNQQLTQYTYL